MGARAWLRVSNLGAPCVLPVTVLSAGPKRVHVRLEHRLRWNREWYPAGSARYVPAFAVNDYPLPGELVSVGGGRFVSPATPAADKAVRRWAGWVVPLTDRVVRKRLTRARAAGRFGVRP